MEVVVQEVILEINAYIMNNLLLIMKANIFYLFFISNYYYSLIFYL